MCVYIYFLLDYDTHDVGLSNSMARPMRFNKVFLVNHWRDIVNYSPLRAHLEAAERSSIVKIIRDWVLKVELRRALNNRAEVSSVWLAYL